MNDIKALFFDIDGTLVPFGHHEPPAEVMEALAAVRRKGVKVFIATGRHISWIDNLGKLEVDGYVTANGSLCLEADGKTVIYCHSIPSDDIGRLIDFSLISDMPLVAIPDDGGIIINREDENVARIREMLNMPYVPLAPLDTVGGKNIVQLMAFGSEQTRERSGLLETVLLGCEATSWNPYFCDIVPKGSDKSVGIDRMLKRHKLQLSQCAAFGDGDNDIGMLRHAGIGIAMGNAGTDVKSVADYVTTAVDDHGIVKALHHLGLY